MSEPVTPTPTIAEAITEAVSPTQSTEPQVTETKETPKPEPLSAQFAALQRKSKALEEARSKWKAEKAKEETELSEYRKWKEEQAKVAQTPKSRKNPIEALMAEGWTYADASAFVMNDEKPTPEIMVKEVESKLEAFKREQEEKEARRKEEEQELQTKAQTEAIEQFKGNIGEFITQNADDYEYTIMYLEPADIQEHVYELIDRHYKQTLEEGTPRILSIKEAADQVEKLFEEKVQLLLNSKKFKPKIEPKEEPNPGTSGFTSKTLSNSSTATSVSPRGPAKTDEERMQRALAILG